MTLSDMRWSMPLSHLCIKPSINYRWLATCGLQAQAVNTIGPFFHLVQKRRMCNCYFFNWDSWHFHTQAHIVLIANVVACICAWSGVLVLNGDEVRWLLCATVLVTPEDEDTVISNTAIQQSPPMPASLPEALDDCCSHIWSAHVLSPCADPFL